MHNYSIDNHCSGYEGVTRRFVRDMMLLRLETKISSSSEKLFSVDKSYHPGMWYIIVLFSGKV